MSMKINNGINSTEAQWIKNNPNAGDTTTTTTSVKLAGEEAKDRLYEPKHKKKLVRVLTVIAYVFFVSLAAIMLSLYYVFLWNGDKTASKYAIPRPEQQIKCDHIVAAMQQQLTGIDDHFSSLASTTEESTTWSDYDMNSDQDFARTSTFIQKLMGGDPYSEND